LKVSVKLATPPESLTESLQQTFNKLSGQPPQKIEKNYIFLKKIMLFLNKKGCVFPTDTQN
jgi:hypothetical protein